MVIYKRMTRLQLFITVMMWTTLYQPGGYIIKYADENEKAK